MSAPARQERLYRVLLRLYPAPFRTRFGDEMVQLFSDQLRDARAGRSDTGVAATWLRILADLAVTFPSEHLRKDRTMARSLTTPPSLSSRALGLLGVAGGLVLVAAFVPNLDWSYEVFNYRLVIFNAGAIGVIVAIHRRQAARSRVLATATAIPAVLANAWYLVMDVISVGRPQFPDPDPEFRRIFFVAGVALWLADAAFGLVAFRLGAVSRLAALALAVGSLVGGSGIGGLAATFPWLSGLVVLVAPFSLWGLALVGLGWILLGIDVATRRRAREDRRPERLGG